ncbi:YceG-like family protein [Gracilibacillus orientalis]|uniref:YceG-like family protein n=1 Tax=Gracilibacillus orientalis TaxID=334253 RepID=A0A1I4KTT5_9BACI|nr:endolytic transglycosylase MltG [Gracilibacillus orientalis]SFL82056.1 YceG-like family protein [Gracilibacillus orientalis]
MKQIIRAFSLGLLVAAVIIGVIFYVEKPEQAQSTYTPTINESIKKIEDDGYYVYEEDLEAKVDQLEQEIEDSQQNTSELEQTDETVVEEATIMIESGMTFPEIVDLLDENELISDEDAFVTYMEENELSTFIQTGEFNLNSGMSVEELVNTLTRQTEE